MMTDEQRAALVDALRSELELLAEMQLKLRTLIETGALEELPDIWRYGDDMGKSRESATWTAVAMRACIECYLRFGRERKRPF